MPHPDNTPHFNDLERLALGDIAALPPEMLLDLQTTALAETARVKRLRDRLEAVPEVERASTPVGSLAERDPALAVSRQAGLDTLLGNPQLRRFGALMVIDERGQLAGVITVEQLGRALRT